MISFARLGTTFAVAAVVALAMLPARSAAADDPVTPTPGMVITKDTTFTPGTYDFPAGEGITIAADGITVDGNGAVLKGPGTSGDPASFTGTGVDAANVSDVNLRGLTVGGFGLALHVRSGSNWTIENNDFSGNYTDPAAGWGDGPLSGAVLLEHVDKSTISANAAHENWNGLTLRYADDNTVTGNDFSHCSDVCLKMWSASRNHIEGNNFSYGIRVDPGETHARDSASALIETASNDNRIIDNDFTHGGDGVFLRPLNGDVSTGNYFEGNDASYAHNNAWESWSPGNTYVRNKGNYSSYGFWLGGSDDTVLIGNEAAFNGTVNANAPEPFGNAGIAIVKGSASHLVLDGNHIHDNKSVGLALGYQPGYEVYHWIIQRNEIANNSTYGIVMRDARWITLADNSIHDNGSGAIQQGANVTEVSTLDGQPSAHAPEAHISRSPQVVYAGEPVTFDASGSSDADGDTLHYRWDLGDGEVSTDARAVHRYLDPGFYRLGLTVDDGGLAAIAHVDVYVLNSGQETGTDDASAWQAGITPKPLEWSVDTAAPQHGSDASLSSGSGPNLDRGIVREVTVPASGATLSFDTYWDTEPQYDYGFVQVSDDGGATWQSLGNTDTTGTSASDAIDTVQRNLPGFNGSSSGWKHESFDLSAYSGKQIRIAWRYVTDGGVDDPGWWIDNVAVGTTVLSDGSTLQGWSPLDPEQATEHASVSADPDRVLEGTSSIRLDSTARDTSLTYTAPLDVSGRDHLQLWLGFAHEAQATFSGEPVIRLVQDAQNYIEYKPTHNYFDISSLPYNEARNGWQLLSVPLAGDRSWTRTTTGSPSLAHISAVQFRMPSTTGAYRLWLDALTFITTPPPPDIAPDLAQNTAAAGNPAPTASYSFPGDWGLPTYDNMWAPLDGTSDNGRLWSNFNSASEQDWYGVDFGTPRQVNQVRVDYVAKAGRLQPPSAAHVEYQAGGTWHPVEGASAAAPAAGRNTITFDPVVTTKLRLVVTNPRPVRGTGTYVGISEFQARDTADLAGNRLGADAPFGTPVPSASSGDPWALVDGAIGPGWRSTGASPWISVDLLRAHTLDTCTLYLGAPVSALHVQYWTGGSWAEVQHVASKPGDPSTGRNELSFDTVTTRRIRVAITPAAGTAVDVRELELSDANLLSAGSTLGLKVTPSASYTFSGDTVWGPLDGSYSDSPRWTNWNSMHPQDWYAVNLDRPVTAGRVDLYFYNDGGGVLPPTAYHIEYWTGSAWKPVTETSRSPQQAVPGYNTVSFEPVSASGFRLVGTNANPVNFGQYIGLTEFELYRND